MNARNVGTIAILSACCFSLLASPAQAAPPTKPMTVCSYPVADLVVPIPSASGPNTETPVTQEGCLRSLIVQTVQPASWAQNGGCGKVEYSPQGMTLVVHQTPDVQAEVTDLLKGLRRMQDVQVALEVRFVTVTEDFCDRVGVDFSAPTRCGGRCENASPCVAPTEAKFLNDKQVYQLLETAQGDRRTNVMQAPKITLMNGQTGTIGLPELRVTAQPVVSADRRFVRVFLKVDPTRAGKTSCTADVKCQEHTVPQAKVSGIESTVAIPDGGTVLFGGLKTMIESRTEQGSPILSKVPYVNRLFKNVGVGRVGQTTLVMVTPRIIVQEEEEERVTTVTAVVESKVSEKSPRQAKVVAELLRACEAASAEGRDEEAGRYIRAALAIDPTCMRR